MKKSILASVWGCAPIHQKEEKHTVKAMQVCVTELKPNNTFIKIDSIIKLADVNKDLCVCVCYFARVWDLCQSKTLLRFSGLYMRRNVKCIQGHYLTWWIHENRKNTAEWNWEIWVRVNWRKIATFSMWVMQVTRTETDPASHQSLWQAPRETEPSLPTLWHRSYWLRIKDV